MAGHILVIRFSALGDTAMAVHSVYNTLEHNKDIQITVLTRVQFSSLFQSHPRLNVMGVDLNSDYKGVLGMRNLAKELKKLKLTAVADIHNVLRTKLLRFFLKLPNAVTNKDRKTKEAMVNKKIPLAQLKHSNERYLEVFSKLGLHFSPSYQYIWKPKTTEKTNAIAIAPLAAHRSKEWGLENWTALVKQILAETDYDIFIFGGKNEEQTLHRLKFSDRVKVKVNLGSLAKEMDEMKACKLMIAQDSANMHLADLAGIPVISIWISTHPYFGFYPLGNREHYVLPDGKMFKSYPLSVYGKLKNKVDSEFAKEIAASITPAMLLEKIKILSATE